ncbi:hypothetical protein PSACC_01517 [Paramicrosporidium saccamoebae]|uniref:Man(5)GlcNAc(2)-PP-dolichol translocation protein RFT1 n=1 Tax=Paramicrosporidium saccamoebae TaxID=1246581 RepID=A0A2H9TLS3_9FUNG|nr:hypothetical protein PSACC_01517 [Paramicrosporidium saccamoebae]
MRWALGAAEITHRNALYRWFFSTGQVLPIRRGEGVLQPSMNDALGLLANGQWLHVFPEGKVIPDSAASRVRLKWGIGRLVLDSKIPPVVLPIVHQGLENILPLDSWIPRFGKRLVINIGEPVDTAPLRERLSAVNLSPEQRRSEATSTCAASMSDINSIRQASANVFSLITLQLFSRILAFLLNALLLRRLQPAVLGLATVKLELLYTTVVTLGREGLRRALLRYPPTDDGWKRRLIHMALLAVPCGIPVLVFVVVAFTGSLPTELADMQMRFWLAVGVYSGAALLELAVEPMYLLCVHLQMVRKRIPVESLAVTLRAVVVLTICLTTAKGANLSTNLALGLIAYPLGQLAYSVSLVLGYFYILRGHLFPLRPLLPYPEIEVEESILQTALDMSKQVMLRYFLSQGDMWIISLLAPLPEQGVYAVVNNYGSLLCRILLQPMEEAALCFFSQTLAKPRQAALDYLGLLLKVDFLLSMLVVVYGVPLSRPLVETVLGTRWSSSGMSTALAMYCFLIPAMAFSGILEAFLHAAITRPWNSFYQNTSLLSTVLFVMVAVIGTIALGPVGLIMANIVNFSIRGAASWYFLKAYAAEHKLNIVPFHYHKLVYTYFSILLPVFLWISNGHLDATSLFSRQSLFILGTLPVTAAVIYICERPFISYLYAIRSKDHTE